MVQLDIYLLIFVVKRVYPHDQNLLTTSAIQREIHTRVGLFTDYLEEVVKWFTCVITLKRSKRNRRKQNGRKRKITETLITGKTKCTNRLGKQTDVQTR